jgi:hypothetical protein
MELPDADLKTDAAGKGQYFQKDFSTDSLGASLVFPFQASSTSRLSSNCKKW